MTSNSGTTWKPATADAKGYDPDSWRFFESAPLLAAAAGGRPAESLARARNTLAMRIIGGSAGGLHLEAPKGFDLRPTPDLVRQALFNSLASRVQGARALELFAGTGALSLECLSRGAALAVCIEKSARHARFILRNLQHARLPAACLRVRVQDAFTAARQLAAECQQFDLILADPPYGPKNLGRRSTSFAQQLLDERALPELLHPAGLFILGHAKRDTLSVPPAWEETKLLKHGDTLMRFLRRSDAGDTVP